MPELIFGHDDCQKVELDKVNDVPDDNNDTEVMDTSLFWPRNRKLASGEIAADTNGLFPFEKQSQ